MNDAEYWQKRAIDRLVASEQSGKDLILQTFRVYNDSLLTIQREIQSIYDNYANKGVLGVDELKRALNPVEKAKFLKAVSTKVKQLGINPKDVYDERYLYRLTRLEAIQEQTRVEVATLAPQLDKISTKTYRDIIEKTYKNIQSDLSLQGVNPSFATINSKGAKTILESNWLGSNYSKRIYANVDKLAKELPLIIAKGSQGNFTYTQMIGDVRSRFNVGKSNATRLIRTETNYFHNESQKQAYKDDQIDTYRFDAVMDDRTSQVCQDHDGNVYNVDDAAAGDNYPPLHPNCRSSTSAVV